MVRRGRISTHTLRMERDYWLFWDVLLFFMFQSTRSAWSATPGRAGRMVPPMISIHALRMERDVRYHKLPAASKPFQSTRSAWSATTRPISGRSKRRSISIHALRMERDRSPAPAEARLSHFNPRAPHGARQGRHENGCGMPDFNPRAPHGARPGEIFEKAAGQKFQSTRSAWSATTYLQDKAVSD